MNEDKELEEAIQWLNDFTNIIAINKQYTITEGRLTKVQEAIKIVLQALDNSIPKKKIEDKINKLDLEIDEEYEKNMAYHQLVYARCELKELMEE